MSLLPRDPDEEIALGKQHGQFLKDKYGPVLGKVMLEAVLAVLKAWVTIGKSGASDDKAREAMIDIFDLASKISNYSITHGEGWGGDDKKGTQDQ